MNWSINTPSVTPNILAKHRGYNAKIPEIFKSLNDELRWSLQLQTNLKM